MKNIVIIVRNYVPYNSAVGVCMKNISECLQDQTNIYVICEKTRIDEKNYETINNQHIIRVLTRQSFIRKILKKHGMSNNLIVRVVSKFFFQIVRLWYNSLFLLSPYSLQYNLVKKYLNALKSLDIQIDLIIPACMPFESIIAAQKYCDINKNTGYIPILFDKFAANGTLHRLRLNKKIKMKNNIKIETLVFANERCRKIMYVNSWEKHIVQYHSTLKSKFELIEHPLIKKITNNSFEKFYNNKINIVYTGALTLAGRNPDYTLGVFEKIISQNEDYVVHLFAAGDAISIIKDYEKKMPNNIYYYGQVPLDTAHSAMMESNILLSIGNVDITQTPSKIFEYMSCGKPIIHIAAKMNDPVFEILKRYPFKCYVCCENMTTNEIIENITSFIGTNYTNIVDTEFLEKEYKTAVPSYSANLILKYGGLIE